MHPMFKQPFEACIFDFDGVLIDSEPIHAAAKRHTLDHFQITYPETIMADFKGRPDKDFFAHVVTHLAPEGITFDQLDGYKRDVYLQMFGDVPQIPGAAEFLAFARSCFPKIGLATSATQRDFSLTADKYGLRSWFDVIVTGEDTRKHKPDPEPYLMAMAQLEVDAAATLVIEDSPNGIRAGRAAGCSVVGITTNFAAATLHEAGAHLVVASFPQLQHQLERLKT